MSVLTKRKYALKRQKILENEVAAYGKDKSTLLIVKHMAKEAQKAWAAVDAAKDKIKTNPRPRIGKKKATRPSTATGKRASKRLVARRKRNEKKGFFPNPTTKVYLQRLGNTRWLTYRVYRDNLKSLAELKRDAYHLHETYPKSKIRLIRK